MRKLTAFVMTAGHLDIEWYQPMRSYRFWTVEALQSLKDRAAPRDDFKCYVLDGQVFPLEEYLEVLPGDEAAMRELIRQKKLVIGPFYTQFDEWLPSPENIIRNCLYGRKKAEAYGGYMRAGYLPDNFGHPMQMPQILRGFGIDSLMFMRGMPEIPGGHPDEFIYRGLDGSEVLVSHFRESYSGAFDIFNKGIDGIQPREVPYYGDYQSFEYHMALADHDDPDSIAKNMIANVRRIEQRYPSGVIPLIGGFDHLPPQINVGDSIKLANEMQDEIEFIMGDAEDYVRLVQSRMEHPAVYDMELIGSKYQHILLGALSTRSYLKQQNFGCEALLERYAEPLDAIAGLYGFPSTPTLLDEAWKYLMINSAHDSIHGSSVDEVHIDMESRFGGARQIAAGLIHASMAHIGQRTQRFWTPGEQGVLAYAPVGAKHAQPVELWLPIKDRAVSMAGKDGSPLPTQILAREPIELNSAGNPRNDPFPDNEFRKVLFLAEFEGGELRPFATTPELDATPGLDAGDAHIENELVRVEASDSGLIHIYDKRTGRWHRNLNLIEEDADSGDAWDYAPTWAPGELVRSSSGRFQSRLIECGPVRAKLALTGTLSVPARLIGDQRSHERVALPMRYEITVYRGTRRVDVKLTIDNQAKDHRLRLRVPMGMKAKSILSQSHLAVLDRPIERQKEIEPWYQPPTQLLPCREWIAARDSEWGLAVALKGLYDYEAIIDPLTNRPDVYVTLLRGVGVMGRRHTPQRFGSASPASPTPGAQCLGERVFEWAFAPYAPLEEDVAPFLPAVQGFLYPPVGHAVRSEAVSEMALPGAVLSWDAPNVQFSCLKRAMDGDGIVVRLYENQGLETTVRVSAMGYARAQLVGMDERGGEALAVDGGAVALRFAPYKALTVKFTQRQS